MNNPALLAMTNERDVTTGSLNIPTWRYLGDRDEADRAYCTRFGVPEAPEPVQSLGGGLAYPLPPIER